MRRELTGVAASVHLDVHAGTSKWHEGITLTPQAGHALAGIDWLRWSYDPANGHVVLEAFDPSGQPLGPPVEFTSVEKALEALAIVRAGCDALGGFPTGAVSNVRLVTSGGTARLAFEIRDPATLGATVLGGSLHLEGYRARHVTWEFGLGSNQYATHDMASIGRVKQAVQAGGVSIGMKLIDGSRVLCASFEDVFSLGPPLVKVTWFERLDEGQPATGARYFMTGYAVAGSLVTFEEPLLFSMWGPGSLAWSRLVNMAGMLATVHAAQPGVSFSTIKTAVSGADDIQVRVHVGATTTRPVAVLHVVFETGTADVLRVDYRDASRILFTTMLSEPAGRVEFITNKDGSITPQWKTAGRHNWLASIITVNFPGLGPMTFPDWLRNHDVTANNFLALSQARRLELFVAFLKGEMFYGEALEAGNPDVQNILLTWEPLGRLNFRHPVAPAGGTAWMQAQLGMNNVYNEPWFSP